MTNNSIIVLLAIILAGCRVETEKGPNMNSESFKVYCVARHLISIPGSFVESPVINGMFKFDGADAQEPEMDVVVYADINTKLKFNSAVQRRRYELSRSESQTTNLLKLDKQLLDGSTLFRVQEIDDAYFSEIYFLRGSAMVKIKLDSYNNGYLKAEEQMGRLAMRIKERDLSKEIGNADFCLGPLSIDADLSQEVATFNFRDKQGLTLEMNVDTFSRDEAIPLLSRMSSPDSLLKKFDVRHEVLRARERKIAGMQADEWLSVAQLGEGDKGRRLKFVVETKRKNPAKSTPSIVLTLSSGQALRDGTPAKLGLKNEGAVSLWDRIVESIQLRANKDIYIKS